MCMNITTCLVPRLRAKGRVWLAGLAAPLDWIFLTITHTGERFCMLIY
jgi:hypothetical protein